MNFQIHELLGCGSFAKVYSGKYNKEKVAIKIYDLFQLNDYQIPYVYQEIEIMQKSSNPNIIRYITHYETPKNIYIIMECCDKTLEAIWKEDFRSIMPESTIVNGFSHLHSINIIHRDIKLENIMAKNSIFKLTDFGSSKFLKSKDDLTDTLVGSPMTMAPEIINSEHYGIEADMYSLGVILFQMLMGTYPFRIIKGVPLEQVIKPHNLKFNENISLTFQELIKKMLQFSPKKRISWKELYNHPYLAMDKLARTTHLDISLSKNKLIYTNLQETQIIESIILDDLQGTIQKNLVQSIIMNNNPDEDAKIDKLYWKRNCYMQIYKGYSSLKELLATDYEIDITKEQDYLKNLAYELYESTLQDLDSNNYNQCTFDQIQRIHDLKQLVLEDDKLVMSALQSQKSFISRIYQSLFAEANKSKNLKETIKQMYRKLVLCDQDLNDYISGVKIEIQHKCRICMINLLGIYSIFEDLQASADFKQQDIELDEDCKDPDKLLSRITQLTDELKFQV